jgi:hypothetical protein
MNNTRACGRRASHETAKRLEPTVDELERTAIVRYQNLRALGEMIRHAARREDARARLDAALARHA